MEKISNKSYPSYLIELNSQENLKVKFKAFVLGSKNINLRKIRINLIKLNILKIFLYFAYIYVAKEKQEVQNFCNISISKFLLSFCLQQCMTENGEDDNGFVTNRNGLNTNVNRPI